MEILRTRPLLLTLAALLATTLPLPAPVTVLPEATPKPAAKAKPKEEPKPKPKPRAAPAPSWTALAGTWTGTLNIVGTAVVRGKGYPLTATQPITVTITSSGMVTPVFGSYNFAYTGSSPPGELARGSLPGAADPTRVGEGQGSSLSYSYRTNAGSTVRATITPRANGSTASYRSGNTHPGGGRFSSSATLTRIR
jgi:hypothetical protein